MTATFTENGYGFREPPEPPTDGASGFDPRVVTLEAPPRVVAVPSAAGPTWPTPGGLRAPHIEDWVEVPGYPGHRARVWVNFPQRLLSALRSGEQDTVANALCQIVLEHNGWPDEEGTPYPPASDPTFWEAIPTHLATAVLAAVNARATANPLAPVTRGR